MKLHSPSVAEKHKQLLEQYKQRLAEIENQDNADEEEDNAPFERSFLYNAIYLHTLWFEQLEGSSEHTEAPLLEEILEQRESDLDTFQKWMTSFAKDAAPHGWAIWGWSYNLKTFVGFPIQSHDELVPLGVVPVLVIDCWEHSYLEDYGVNFDEYMEAVWKEMNWQKIENRHQELASVLGFNIK